MISNISRKSSTSTAACRNVAFSVGTESSSTTASSMTEEPEPNTTGIELCPNGRISRVSLEGASCDEQDAKDVEYLGGFWQVCLLIGSLPFPIAGLWYAFMKDSFFLYLGWATSVFSGACVILVIVSDPSNKNIEPWLRTYIVLWFLTSFGGTGYGTIFDLHSARVSSGIVYFLLGGINCFLGCIFGIRFRSRIGSLPHTQLEYYIDHIVFKGGLASLPAILYLSIGTAQCTLGKLDDSGEFRILSVLTNFLSIQITPMSVITWRTVWGGQISSGQC